MFQLSLIPPVVISSFEIVGATGVYFFDQPVELNPLIVLPFLSIQRIVYVSVLFGTTPESVNDVAVVSLKRFQPPDTGL